MGKDLNGCQWIFNCTGVCQGSGAVGCPRPWGLERNEQSSETAAAVAFEEQAVYLYPPSAFEKKRLCEMYDVSVEQ